MKITAHGLIDGKTYPFTLNANGGIYLHYRNAFRVNEAKPSNHKSNQIEVETVEDAIELLETGKFTIRLTNKKNHTGSYRTGLYYYDSLTIEV